MRFEEMLPLLKEGGKLRRVGWGEYDGDYGDMYISIVKPEMRSHKCYITRDEILLWSNGHGTYAAQGHRKGFRDEQCGIIAWDGKFYGIEWKTMSFEILENDWELYNEAV